MMANLFAANKILVLQMTTPGNLQGVGHIVQIICAFSSNYSQLNLPVFGLFFQLFY